MKLIRPTRRIGNPGPICARISHDEIRSGGIPGMEQPPVTYAGYGSSPGQYSSPLPETPLPGALTALSAAGTGSMGR
jgi:hypothetical protein